MLFTESLVLYFAEPRPNERWVSDLHFLENRALERPRSVVTQCRPSHVIAFGCLPMIDSSKAVTASLQCMPSRLDSVRACDTYHAFEKPPKTTTKTLILRCLDNHGSPTRRHASKRPRKGCNFRGAEECASL